MQVKLLIALAVCGAYAVASHASLPVPDNVSEARISGAPIHLYRDRGGLPYALQLEYAERPDGRQEYRFQKKYLTAEDHANLGIIGAPVAYLPDVDLPGRDAKVLRKTEFVCNYAQVPSSFNISYVSGTVYGNVYVCATNTRPNGTHTQYIDFTMFADNYAGNAAHTPVVLWFKNTLHGHGMYFGDTSAHACANGRSATFNTRIEAWSQWYTPGTSTPGPYWTSTGPFLTDTCGEPLQNGWIQATGIVYNQYNINVHASDGQWVQYLVNRWNGSSWVTHTSPVVKNVTYSAWTTPDGPGVFDSTANGVFIGSTGPMGSGVGGNWHIGIRSLTTGWF